MSACGWRNAFILPRAATRVEVERMREHGMLLGVVTRYRWWVMLKSKACLRLPAASLRVRISTSPHLCPALAVTPKCVRAKGSALVRGLMCLVFLGEVTEVRLILTPSR